MGAVRAQDVHDLLCRLFGGHRCEGQRVADAEPGILRTVTPFEEGVPGAPRAHEPRADRAHLDAVARELGTQAVGEAHEGELACAVRQKMRHADLAADGGHVHDAASSPPSHVRQYGQNGIEGPQKLTSMARRKSSTPIVSTGPTVITPALLTRASSGPSSLA